MLEILFEDENLIAINKPSGLLVHRTSIAAGETAFALQILRDQIGAWVSPVHRLDRPTSGVLLFSKNKESEVLLKTAFEERKVNKSYLAICRGTPIQKEGIIDYPLTSEYSDKAQEAVSSYRVLSETEISFDTTGRYPTSRYSLISISPKTGRTHQIRKHLAHLRHYILGDKKHGDNKQNKFFHEKFGLENLLLHGHQLEFVHPLTDIPIQIQAPLPNYFTIIADSISLNLNQIPSFESL